MAATLLGGSDLLNDQSATQLETWLGQGSIQLRNIYDKQAANTSYDFHAAANGRGATFSIVEVTGVGGNILTTPVSIGGYNPQSWSSDTQWNFTVNDSLRTAFVFNLTTSNLFRQALSNDYQAMGSYQTYNNGFYGPTFGAGHDIYVDQSLDSGFSFLHSYSSGSNFSADIAIYPNHYAGENLQFGQIEVFSVSAVMPPPVPEPATYILLFAGLCVITKMSTEKAKL